MEGSNAWLGSDGIAGWRAAALGIGRGLPATGIDHVPLLMLVDTTAAALALVKSFLQHPGEIPADQLLAVTKAEILEFKLDVFTAARAWDYPFFLSATDVIEVDDAACVLGLGPGEDLAIGDTNESRASAIDGGGFLGGIVVVLEFIEHTPAIPGLHERTGGTGAGDHDVHIDQADQMGSEVVGIASELGTGGLGESIEESDLGDFLGLVA